MYATWFGVLVGVFGGLITKFVYQVEMLCFALTCMYDSSQPAELPW